MGLSGMAVGASRALEDIVAERILQQKLEQEVAERQQRMAMEQQRMDEGRRQFDVEAGQRNRQLDAQDSDRRARSNQTGVRRMLGEALTQGDGPMNSQDRRGLAALQVEAGDAPTLLNEPKAERDPIADHEAKARIDAKYRAPSAGQKPDYQRVVVDGKETFLTPEEVRARGGVDAASRKRASTGMERQALGFYNRMKDALDTMDAVEDQVPERDLMLINNSPLPDLINNRLLSTAGQQYAQALQTYTEGRLRKESGAAIADTEYANDRKTIGRQANDQDVVRQQKKQTRRKTHEGIGYAAGPAYEEFYGEPFQRMSGGGGGAVMQRPIPGVEGGIAESKDGGKTWVRVK
jgi:hypothetical protein